eukprot:4943842-Pyramimonas_sp.AAC.1
MEHERNEQDCGKEQKTSGRTRRADRVGRPIASGSERRAQATRSSRRSADACVLHESRGSLERQHD